MMIAGMGFMTVVVASAFLDGPLWHGAVIAYMIGAAMLWYPTIRNWIRRMSR